MNSWGFLLCFCVGAVVVWDSSAQAASISGIRNESPKTILSRRLKSYTTTYPVHHGNHRILRGGSIDAGGGSVAEARDDNDEDDEAETATSKESSKMTTAQDDDTRATDLNQHVQDAHDHDDNGVMVENNTKLQDATALRHKGKELHDAGDWLEAAHVFAQAADLVQDEPAYLTDYCTCRLHEALCRLKMNDYDSCVQVCTGILALSDLTGAIRSRAHHRRAKAHLNLGNHDEALQDARAAAFLGDRKAVALYGQLMRGNSGTVDELASPSMLNDLLQGRNPFLSANSNEKAHGNPMLLESLLSKSTMGGETPSLLGQGGAGGTLAKSLLSSLTKRLETDSDSICAYLQKTNPAQLQQLGSLAGVPLSESQATRLVKFCHSVTPKAIRRTVKLGKVGWYGLTLMRKVYKLVTKYKHILVLWALAAWIQSAIRRPIPISKKAAKLMAKTATAAAAAVATT